MKLNARQRRNINEQLRHLKWELNDFLGDPNRYFEMPKFKNMHYDDIKHWFEEEIWKLERMKM